MYDEDFPFWMKKGKLLIVELRRPEREEALRKENQRLQDELKRMREAYHRVEQSLGVEVYLNGELVDLLRMHQINFRQMLDHREREKRLGK